MVSPGYFDALGIPVVRGRETDRADGAQAPAVAVVNAAFVRRFRPDGDPVGRHLRGFRRSRGLHHQRDRRGQALPTAA